MSNGALEALEHIEFCYRSELVMDSAVQKDIDTIRKQLKRADGLQAKLDVAETCLKECRDEFWDEWHPNMSQEQFDNHWLIKSIRETLTQIRNKA